MNIKEKVIQVPQNLNEFSKIINKFVTEEKGFHTPTSIHRKDIIVNNRYNKNCKIEEHFNPEQTTVKLALIITEVCEAIEAVRKGDEDNFKEEIADTFIRLFDLVGAMNIDIEEEIVKAMQKNIERPVKHNKLF